MKTKNQNKSEKTCRKKFCVESLNYLPGWAMKKNQLNQFRDLNAITEFFFQILTYILKSLKYNFECF